MGGPAGAVVILGGDEAAAVGSDAPARWASPVRATAPWRDAFIGGWRTSCGRGSTRPGALVCDGHAVARKAMKRTERCRWGCVMRGAEQSR